jgi:peptidyl-prolyl cis-trans isomerase C
MYTVRYFLSALAVLWAACVAAPNPPPPTAPATFTPPAKASVESAPTNARATDAPAVAAPAAAPSDPAPKQQPVANTEASGVVVATVAGKPIDITELLSQWMHQASLDVKEQIDRLVLSRLVLEESKRLGLSIDPDFAEKAYADAAVRIEKEIGKKRPGLSLDRYVDQGLGLDPKVYRERLRDDALRGLLTERVMRAFMLQTEHADLRVLVVKSEEDLKLVQSELAAGKEFEDVAREHSADPSAKDGGRVPPVIRSNTVMGNLAFETPVGSVGGPKYEQGAWLLAKVVARPEPLVGSWNEIRDTVEASLKERTVEDLEASQWQTAMLRRYDVDITPLMKLVGEPVRQP